jgi:hypothetical protein
MDWISTSCKSILDKALTGPSRMGGPQRSYDWEMLGNGRSRPISRVLSRDSHSSRMRVTTHLKRPTREPCGPHVRVYPPLPYLVLLRVGFSMPRPVTRRAVRSYRTFSPLPEPEGHRRCVFCGTFRRLAPPRRYLAPCPVEPGLSSA